MAKYLEAARQTADHLVLKPDGFAFAPYPMLVETDRERYTIQRIVDFYDRQPTDFADYFEAAWRYKHRAALGEPKATLAIVAARNKAHSPLPGDGLAVSRRRKKKSDPARSCRPCGARCRLPSRASPDIAHARLRRDARLRSQDSPPYREAVQAPAMPGMGANIQPFVMWRNREIAAHRRDFDPTALRVEGEPPPGDFIVTEGPTFGKGEEVAVKQAIADYIKDRQDDPDLVVPAGQRARYEAAFARFSPFSRPASTPASAAVFIPSTPSTKDACSARDSTT